jgi:hypothetical protein
MFHLLIGIAAAVIIIALLEDIGCLIVGGIVACMLLAWIF